MTLPPTPPATYTTPKGSIELVEFHTMLLELMRTSFMQCMADLVQREKVLLINR